MVNTISGANYSPYAAGMYPSGGYATPYQEYPQSVFQAYPEEQVEEKKGGHGFLKFLAFATLATAGGVAARKLLMKDYQVIKEMPKDAKRMDKVKNTFANWMDKIYENTVVKVKGWFSDKKASGNGEKPTAETATGTAAETAPAPKVDTQA